MRANEARLFATLGIAAGAGLLLAAAGGAHAQSAPPAWNTLVRCAQTPDETARLACYDSAMRAAGYAPNPTAVAEAHRKGFGLPFPKVSALNRHKKEEGRQAGGAAPETPEANPDVIEVSVDQIAITQPLGRIVIFTTEGQIWQQTDSTQISEYPKEGDSITIHKGVIGGYLCDANKYQSVRCKRVK